MSFKLLLLQIGVSTAPLFDFDYSATSKDGVDQRYSGTEFYLMEQPRIQLEAGYCSTRFGCGTIGVDTGYNTSKQDRSPELRWTPTFSTPLDDSTFLEIKPSVAFGGMTSLESCVDEIDRAFHCYFGTQPNSPLYLYSFEQIDALYDQDFIRLTDIQINLKWVF